MNLQNGALVRLCLVSCVALAGPAAAGVLREGDSFKLRLGAGVSGASNGDTIAVSVRRAFPADPKNPPVLAAGLAGTITLRLGDKSKEGQKFEVAQFTYYSKGKKVSVPVRLANPSQGVIKNERYSLVKKLLLPPVLGMFIWHNRTSPHKGSDLTITVAKTARNSGPDRTAPQGLLLSDSETESLYQRGIEAQKAQRPDEALRLMDMVWASKPDYPGVSEFLKREYLARGMDLFAAGRLEEAVSQWEKVLRIDPADARARAYLARAKEQLARSRAILGVSR